MRLILHGMRVTKPKSILDNLGYDGSDMILRKGLRIYTTLDLDIQRQLECVTRSHVFRLGSGDPTFTHNTNIGTSCTAAEFLPPLNDDMVGTSRHGDE